MRIEGSVAVVVGAAQEGMGKAYCHALLRNGAKVCFGDVLKSEGEKVAEEFNLKYGANKAVFVQCDVTKDEDVENLFQVAKETFGKIDIAIDNAAIINEFNWKQCLDINVGGVIRVTTTAFKYMGKDQGGQGGTIVHTASRSGLYPDYWGPVYCASKHAVVAYCRAWAMPQNYIKHGVRINMVCPGTVDTPFLNFICPEKSLHASELQEVLASAVKLQPSDVADVLIGLVEDDTCNGIAVLVLPEPYGNSRIDFIQPPC